MRRSKLSKISQRAYNPGQTLWDIRAFRRFQFIPAPYTVRTILRRYVPVGQHWVDKRGRGWFEKDPTGITVNKKFSRVTRIPLTRIVVANSKRPTCLSIPYLVQNVTDVGFSSRGLGCAARKTARRTTGIRGGLGQVLGHVPDARDLPAMRRLGLGERRWRGMRNVVRHVETGFLSLGKNELVDVSTQNGRRVSQILDRRFNPLVFLWA